MDASQTHFGFTNNWSEMHTFSVIAKRNFKFWFGSPCITHQKYSPWAAECIFDANLGPICYFYYLLACSMKIYVQKLFLLQMAFEKWHWNFWIRLKIPSKWILSCNNLISNDNERKRSVFTEKIVKTTKTSLSGWHWNLACQKSTPPVPLSDFFLRFHVKSTHAHWKLRKFTYIQCLKSSQDHDH